MVKGRCGKGAEEGHDAAVGDDEGVVGACGEFVGDGLHALHEEVAQFALGAMAGHPREPENEIPGHDGETQCAGAEFGKLGFAEEVFQWIGRRVRAVAKVATQTAYLYGSSSGCGRRALIHRNTSAASVVSTRRTESKAAPTIITSTAAAVAAITCHGK